MSANRLKKLRYPCGLAALFLSGCASPGPPRPPSLRLPQPLRNLSAAREGNEVELRFTLPQHTTDNLPLRPPVVQATLCRGLERDPCVLVPGRESQQLSISEPNGTARAIIWRDPLPPALTAGPPRVLIYRVQLENTRGRTAGWSASAYTLAGAAPPSVKDLHAEATRQGILLRWRPAPRQTTATDVLLHREPIGPPPTLKAKPKSKNEPTWFATNADTAGTAAAESLDSSAQENVPYRYTAVRRQKVSIDGHPLEMRSADSAPIEITLRDIFPPPVPTALNAAAFTEAGHFAVDLVWEPVEDPGLAGYIIERQPIDASGTATGPSQRLSPTPVTLPAFHDASANPAQRYRYSVSALDTHNNRSAAVSVIVEPSQPQ
ncbi:MAG TPA: hypothetical protein VIJ65_00145 [Acidobacteriaceae bacterium]